MRYFPLFIDAQDTPCLIVGGGEVAARKLELLLKTPARITLVAPWFSEETQRLATTPQVTLVNREFQETDLINQRLVFVATNDEVLNAHIRAIADNYSCLVNVVDNTPLCQFITPSIIDRSPITIALSSGGNAPVLLRYLRQKLESVIPTNISRLGDFAQRYRDKVKAAFSSVTERRYFWEDIFDGDVAELVEKNQLERADKIFAQKLEAAQQQRQTHGEVYLVGAGPGDADLLTFRALRLMQKADVVIYDRLVSKEILELVRRDAEKLYVGKEKSNHSVPQDQINQLMIDEAKQGKRVVRLKGGDPFIFGRGGEEAQALIAAGVGFQVVPGITAASGASSYAGIPLTHRDHAQSVTFATGHLRDNSIDLDWPALAKPGQTLVFYMGLTGLRIICEQLIAHGLSPTTPIGLIEKATRVDQQVITATLDTILSHPRIEDIAPPTLIIVGGVVSLHEQFKEFLYT